MQKLTSPEILSQLIKLDPNGEGVALHDSENKWLGVFLTASHYQLLQAVASLASDPHSYEKSVSDNREFQAMHEKKRRGVTVEQLLSQELQAT